MSKRNTVTVDDLDEDEQLVGIMIYNHTRDKLLFKATESTGCEGLIALLKKEMPDMEFISRDDE